MSTIDGLLTTPRVGEVVLAGDVQKLYGLLRLLIPDPAEQEEVLINVLTRAARGARSPVHAGANGNGNGHSNGNGRNLGANGNANGHRNGGTQPGLNRGPLMELLLEEMAETSKTSWDGYDPNAGSFEAGEFEERPALLPDTLAGVNDTTLGALVRTLPLPQRQSLVLRLICGVDAHTAGETLGREPGEVEALTGRGVDAIEAHLLEHQERDAELRRELWEANPYRLRPQQGMSPLGAGPANFNTVVKGTRVYATLPPKDGPLAMLLRALRAIVDRLMKRDEDFDLDDDVGDVESPNSPERTPGQKVFEKPKRTPSLRDYASPKLSPGVAVYAMPRPTPTTERISNPQRPLQTRPSWGTTKGRTFLTKPF